MSRDRGGRSLLLRQSPTTALVQRPGGIQRPSRQAPTTALVQRARGGPGLVQRSPGPPDFSRQALSTASVERPRQIPPGGCPERSGGAGSLRTPLRGYLPRSLDKRRRQHLSREGRRVETSLDKLGGSGGLLKGPLDKRRRQHLSRGGFYEIK